MRSLLLVLAVALGGSGLGCSSSILSREGVKDARGTIKKVQSAFQEEGILCEDRSEAAGQATVSCTYRGVRFALAFETHNDSARMYLAMSFEHKHCNQAAFVGRLLEYNRKYPLATVSCGDDSLLFWHTSFLSSGFSRRDLVQTARYWVVASLDAAEKFDLFQDPKDEPRENDGGVKTRTLPATVTRAVERL
jgi:hypothetical protein